MPKKKSISIDEPSTSRPQRNTKAKIVFDPSDNYLPKKRTKKPYEKKKSPDSKSKPIPVNELTTIDSSSNEINTISPVPSRSTSPIEEPVKLEIFQEDSDICCICSTNTPKREFIDCPICFIKIHKDCLLINEPMWKFQLDTGSWLCGECRINHCSKCLQDDSELALLCICITCKFGLHMQCYDSFEIKPLHSLKSDMFICIPCMTLATQRVPEVEEDEDLVSTYSASTATSEDEDQDLKSVESSNSSSGSIKNEENSSAIPEIQIPDVTSWNKYELYNYLIEQNLLKSIAKKIIDHEIDGCALHLLKRNDIVMNMDLLLGNALALYKQVRILQTRSTFPAVYWE